MKREFPALANQEFDLVIVGGGAFGAAAAWDASLRGLSVALVERADFGGGTSANSFKIVHGGIRYLQHGDLLRLRASCQERTALLTIAPHLVTPLPIVVPTYGRGRQGKGLLGAGMLLYDALTLDRNLGVRERTRRIPGARFLGVKRVQALFPGIGGGDLTGGAVFCDAQMYNPSRLVLAFVTAAAGQGALAVNYAGAERLLRSGDAVVGVTVRDAFTGETVDVRARAVLNAAGPWARELLANEQMELSGTYSRDACFLIPRRFAHGFALALQGRTRDPDALIGRAARHLFLVPWRNYTLCGVWHKVWPRPADEVAVTEAELASFVAELNGALPSLALRVEDVSLWNAGLVPFGSNEPGAEHLRYGKRSAIVDHEREHSLRNLVSLIGVRYTMARADSAKALDLICRKLGRSTSRAPTARSPLPGGDFSSFKSLLGEVVRSAPSGLDRRTIEGLAHNYGTWHAEVTRLADDPAVGTDCLHGSTTLRAQVAYAVREEMAMRLGDIVFRRTDLATGSHPGRRALEEAATLAARELGWDGRTRAVELADVERRFAPGGTLAPSAFLPRSREDWGLDALGEGDASTLERVAAIGGAAPPAV